MEWGLYFLINFIQILNEGVIFILNFIYNLFLFFNSRKISL